MNTETNGEYLDRGADLAIQMAVSGSVGKLPYLPQTNAEVEHFTPDMWVQNAVKLAYMMGAHAALADCFKIDTMSLAVAGIGCARGENL